MANLFLFVFFPLNADAQALADTAIRKDTVPLVQYSVFLNRSIFERIDTTVAPKIPTFFRPHQLNAKTMAPLARMNKTKDWAYVILFGCFGLLAWMQYYFRKRLEQLFRAFLTGRYFNQLVRSGDIYNERLTVNLFFIFIFTLPLLLFEINVFYGLIPIPDMPFGNMILYVIFMAVVLLVYGGKILALHLSGLIFKTQELTAEYILTHYIFNLMEGLVLLPFLLIVLATSSLVSLKILLVIIAGISIYRMLRGFLIGMREAQYSVFYMLIFFFTLEIMPLLLFWKILQKNYPV